MKKVITLMLAILCVGLMFVGCNNTNNPDEGKSTYVTITFKQDGEEDIVKQILKGENLTDIPTPKVKDGSVQEGYTLTWDTTDFTNIRKDMTVNAVMKANTYKIYFDYSGVSCDGNEYMEVKYNQEFVLPTPINALGVKIFVHWIDESGQKVSNGTYNKAGDMTLKAVWDDYHTELYTCR